MTTHYFPNGRIIKTYSSKHHGFRNFINITANVKRSIMPQMLARNVECLRASMLHDRNNDHINDCDRCGNDIKVLAWNNLTDAFINQLDRDALMVGIVETIKLVHINHGLPVADL